jgi:hypothetical protein
MNDGGEFDEAFIRWVEYRGHGSLGNSDGGCAEWELTEQRENPGQPSVRFQAGRRTSAIPFRARPMQEAVRRTVASSRTSEPDRRALSDLARQATGLARDRYRLHETVRHRILADLGTGPVTLNQKLTAWWDLDLGSFRAEVKNALKTSILVAERSEWERRGSPTPPKPPTEALPRIHRARRGGSVRDCPQRCG